MVVTLVVATFLSAIASAPAFANGWGGHYHGRGGGFDPLWPITWPSAAALTIPADIVGTVAYIAAPEPLGYGYAAPPAPVYWPESICNAEGILRTKSILSCQILSEIQERLVTLI